MEPATGSLSNGDAEQLRLLAIGHYVVAALQVLWGFLPVLHLAGGVWMLLSPEARKGHAATPVAVFGAFFVAIALAWMAMSWLLAACLVVAGRSLKRRRRRAFCLVTAAVSALVCIPFGTVLGVLTIVVLLRPQVRDAFA